MATVLQPRRRSYAVLWREDGGPVRAGKLELGPRSLSLANGRARSRASLSSLLSRDLVRIQTTHDPRERIKNQPTIVLERRGGATLTLAVAEPFVSVHEIVQLLADALSGAAAA
jgi:hypothetical protein